jgi:hypothetical protein
MLHYETDVFSASNVVFCANNGVFCALFCANNGMIKDWFHLSILCVCAAQTSVLFPGALISYKFHSTDFIQTCTDLETRQISQHKFQTHLYTAIFKSKHEHCT